MEVSKWIFVKALLITLFVLTIIYSINVYLNDMREETIEPQMMDTVDTLEEMEALTQLMRMFGGNATCVTLKSQLNLIDKKIWKLGNKIEDYRRLTSEFMDDPSYLKQKKKFNRQEVLYLSLLKQIRQNCDMDQTVILYFYKNGVDCKLCDEQSFVLTHINKRIDEEVAIFSFDTDLEIPSVDVLIQYYGVNEYPCLVIEDETFCGLRSRDEVERHLCVKSHDLSIC